MPSPNGFQLARLIRKSSWNKSIPIVIVTGREERQTLQELFSIGATFFLQKPVDRQKLSALFRTVRGGMLENRRRQARSAPGRRNLHGGVADNERSELEPQPRRNSGGNRPPASRRDGAAIVPTARIGQADRRWRCGRMVSGEPARNPIHEREHTRPGIDPRIRR